jgi:transcriptional antiterminator NusG
VIGFVGGERPVEVTDDEIATIKAQISDSEDLKNRRSILRFGETVKINDGPFLNFSGVIEEIEPEKGKLR